jgi:hypothetical protein
VSNLPDVIVFVKDAPARLPTAIDRNGRKFFVRAQFENYKRSIAGLPLIDENYVSVLEFVSTEQAAAELGASRRSLGRRMRAAEIDKQDAEGRGASN